MLPLKTKRLDIYHEIVCTKSSKFRERSKIYLEFCERNHESRVSLQRSLNFKMFSTTRPKRS